MWYNGWVLWLTAPSRLNAKLDVEKNRIAKYHEVTNLAFEAATIAPYGGRDTPRTRLLCLGLDLDKEMIGWGVGESPVLLPRALISSYLCRPLCGCAM